MNSLLDKLLALEDLNGGNAHFVGVSLDVSGWDEALLLPTRRADAFVVADGAAPHGAICIVEGGVLDSREVVWLFAVDTQETAVTAMVRISVFD